MNLFLYIPPHSAHPRNSVNSLVYGLMKTYKLQNTRDEDFLNTTKLLFKRLLDRGYEHSNLKEVFLEAMSKLLDEKIMNRKKKDGTDSPETPLIFHLLYNPRDMSCSKIQLVYEEECATQTISANTFRNFLNRNTGETMKISKMIVAYHKPRNIRDKLVPSKLADIEGKEVSHILGCNFTTLDNK